MKRRSDAPRHPRDRRSPTPWIYSLLIAAGVFLAYANVYQNSFLYGDEERTILKNRYIPDWRHLPQLFTENMEAGAGYTSDYYRPLQLLLYSLFVHSVGVTPWPFHMVSLLYHAMAALCLYALILRLLSPFLDRPTAAGLSMIWAVHPLHAEELAVSSGQASPAHLLGILAACLCFFQAESTEAPQTRIRWRWASYAAACFAILSKESAVVLPALLVIIHWAAAQSGRIPRSTPGGWVRKHAPYWILTGLYVGLRLTVLNFGGTLNFYKHSNPFTEHFSYRLYTLFAALGEGLRLLAWPTGLHPERSWPVYTSLGAPRVWISVLVLSALMGLAWRWRRENPLAAAGILWFFISYAPMSNLVAEINSLFWEHWFYVPSVGLVLAGAAWAGGRGGPGRPLAPRGALLFLVWGAAAVLGTLTWRRLPAFKNQIAYSSYILRYEPFSAKHWNNLGMALADRGEYSEAIRDYQTAIRISDEYPQTHHNLGNAYLALAEPALAEQEFKRAIQIDSRFYASYLALGNLYLAAGRMEEAAQALEAALDIFPEMPEVRAVLRTIKQGSNLGGARAASGPSFRKR